MPDRDDAETEYVGAIRIDALVDADVRLPAERLWANGGRPFSIQAAETRYPAEFQNGSWRFIVRVFLLRGPDATVLVDAGMGSVDVPMGREFARDGRLLEVLRDMGVTAESIDHVVLTHRHDDHVGWATAFENARVHLGAADATDALALEGEYRDRIFRPLLDSGRLSPVREPVTIVPGVSIVPSPGHTPGHLHVLVEDDAQTVAVLGDLVHLGFQVSEPAAPGPFDADPEPAAAARQRVLASLPDGTLLATAHLPEAFTPLTRPNPTAEDPR